jgi:hypothetical protein
LLTLTALACIATAVPQWQAFRQREAHRAAVRQTMAAQLGVARSMLAANRADGAAVATIRAEFPRRLEGHLFRLVELDGFDRQIATVRAAIKLAEDKARLAREARARAEAEEAQRPRPRNVYDDIELERTFGCIFPRSGTIAALVCEAGEQLLAGKDKQALAICEQIVVRDPTHTFSDSFWANVRRRP